MYYVPDGTKKCGYYECKKCGNRFLSLQTMEKIPCPDCEAEIDYEIGPDESMEDILDTAQLLQKIEGEEEVEKMDALLSLAITVELQLDLKMYFGKRLRDHGLLSLLDCCNN